MADKKTPSAAEQPENYEALLQENAQIKEQLEEMRGQLAEMQSQNEQVKKLVAKSLPEKDAASSNQPPAKPEIPQDATFTLNDKQYKVLLPHVTIPGIGYRTAGEILVDEAAQEALVASGSGAIREEL